MHKALKRTLLAVVLLAFFSTISYCSAPYDTETAYSMTIRKTVTGSGFILRQETPVIQSANGVFEPTVKDGARVAGGSSVGVAISGNMNEDLIQKLQKVTARIEQIEQSDSFASIYDSDEARIFTALKDFSSSMRESAHANDLSSATESAVQLNTLLEKKYSSENGGAADKLLLDLKKEKYELEQQLGGIREEVTAPASGLFLRTLDGLEDFGTEEAVSQLTTTKINSFSKIMEQYTPDKKQVAKIADTYVWYVATAIPASEAELLSSHERIQLSIDDSTPVTASILAINQIEGSQECAVIIKCNRNISDIFEKRTAEFEICYEEYSGLKVPSAAIRVVEDVTGVYILSKGENIIFKSIDILAQEDDYFIVRKNFVPPENIKHPSLKLYDNILINPEAVNAHES